MIYFVSSSISFSSLKKVKAGIEQGRNLEARIGAEGINK